MIVFKVQAKQVRQEPKANALNFVRSFKSNYYTIVVYTTLSTLIYKS